MCESFEIKNYSVIISLNERNIFIKFTDNINFISYECNADAKELRLQFELSDIYNIIKKCLLFEDGFDVKINITSNIMKLLFNAKVGGFLKINFEALLREKIMSNDGQLTLNINKIESKYESLLKQFEKFQELFEKTQKENNYMIKALSNADINLNTGNQFYSSLIYKINSEKIEINLTLGVNLEKIELFYQLQKIKFIQPRDNILTKIKNHNVNELEIDCGGENYFNRLTGILNLPNLKTIIINNSPALNYMVLDLTNTSHKIETIKILNCSSQDKIELQSYCQNNNINLLIA